MKTTKYIVAMLSGAAVLASCVKEAVNELPAPQDLITIKAELPEGATTKAGAHVGLSWYWNEGDKIAITGEEGTQIYNIKEGFTPKYAEFVGRPVAGETFTIAYPEKAATADWSAQTQDGNNSYAHLKYAAQLSGVDDYLNFVGEYPESKHRSELDRLYRQVQKITGRSGNIETEEEVKK